MFKKIKILYTVPNFDTAGSGRVTYKIVSHINREIFEPEICCLHGRGPFYKVLESTSIPVHIFPYISNQQNFFSNFLNIFRVANFFRLHQYDIIHSMNYMSEFTEGLSAKLAGIPWVYSKNNMSWGRKRWLVRTALAKVVFAQNTTMIKQFYHNHPKVHWVTDGVDLTEFKKRSAKPDILQELSLKNTRNIITVANLVPIKRIEVLINAFVNISNNFQETKLIIVGADNSEYAESLKAMTKTHNLTGRVIFTGKKLNVIDYLNVSDIFVLPTASLGEGSPVALMEAMAAKVYAIGSNVPGIKDQLKGLPNHLFEPDNINDLTEKILFSLNLPQNVFDSDIQTQYSNITVKFDILKEIRRLEQVYQELLLT